MAGFALTGVVTATTPLLKDILTNLAGTALETISDPEHLGRIGGIIGEHTVWKAESGKRVLWMLEGLGESSARIENAVAGIESTQLAMQGTLGVVQAVSFSTLGVASLSGAYMAWRFAALNRRLDHLSRRIDDVEGLIDAAHRAHLRSSLQFLNDYEQCEKERHLDQSFEEARRAGNIYGQLAQDEADTKARLPVLNYRSRCYYLSLLTEIECLIVQERQVAAVQRLTDEQERLQRIAEVTFGETVAKSPEAYLDPALSRDGVTLELLTEVYRQSRFAGAIDDVKVSTAAEMFEYLRDDIFRRGRGPWRPWRSRGKAKEQFLSRLRFLLACIEDTNRLLLEIGM